MEDNDKDDDNNKDDNKDKGISALGLDRDTGFSRGHQGRQRHRPHDDDNNEEDDDEVEDNKCDIVHILAQLCICFVLKQIHTCITEVFSFPMVYHI